jgi:hypothetical protein
MICAYPRSSDPIPKLAMHLRAGRHVISRAEAGRVRARCRRSHVCLRLIRFVSYLATERSGARWGGNSFEGMADGMGK